jgi:hypothetical protein
MLWINNKGGSSRWEEKQTQQSYCQEWLAQLGTVVAMLFWEIMK